MPRPLTGEGQSSSRWVRECEARPEAVLKELPHASQVWGLLGLARLDLLAPGDEALLDRGHLIGGELVALAGADPAVSGRR